MIHETPADRQIRAAQKAGEARLAYCSVLEESLYDPSVLEGLEVSEPVGPFCGCETCVVREVLDAAWPHILAAGDALIAENAELQRKYTDAVATIAEMSSR